MIIGHKGPSRTATVAVEHLAAAVAQTRRAQHSQVRDANRMQPRTGVFATASAQRLGLTLGLALGLGLASVSACRGDLDVETGETTNTTGDGDADDDADVCDGPAGSTSIGPEQASMLTAEIHARKVVLDCEGRLSSVSVHSPSGSTLLARAAVYADDGGVPGAKLADTATDSNPSAGWLTLDADPVVLQPGEYWIAFVIADGSDADNVSFSFENVASGDSVSASASFGVPPDFFPDQVTPNTRGWSAYMVLLAP
jgi:hypothetical protein